MPTYQYPYDDEVWSEWKETVPRDQPLGERIEELLRADTEGRVMEATEIDATKEQIREIREHYGDPTEETEDRPAVQDVAREGFTTAGDIRDEEITDALGAPDVPEALEYVDFPASRDHDDCVDVVLACHAYLRENHTATKADFVRDVMPDHSLGYDAESALAKIETEGERYRGGWWRSVVTPGLKHFDDVKKPSGGSSEWIHTGDA